MGITKNQLFTDSQNELATIAKVLGHPARIAILEVIINSNSCVNSNLVQDLGLAQATVSQHLKELKNIGLIKGNIQGSSMNYCINTEKWEEVSELFSLFFQQNIITNTNC